MLCSVGHAVGYMLDLLVEIWRSPEVMRRTNTRSRVLGITRGRLGGRPAEINAVVLENIKRAQVRMCWGLETW